MFNCNPIKPLNLSIHIPEEIISEYLGDLNSEKNMKTNKTKHSITSFGNLDNGMLIPSHWFNS